MIDAALGEMGYGCVSDGSGFVFYSNSTPTGSLLLDYPADQKIAWIDLEGDLEVAGVDISQFTKVVASLENGNLG